MLVLSIHFTPVYLYLAVTNMPTLKGYWGGSVLAQNIRNRASRCLHTSNIITPSPKHSLVFAWVAGSNAYKLIGVFSLLEKKGFITQSVKNEYIFKRANISCFNYPSLFTLVYCGCQAVTKSFRGRKPEIKTKLLSTRNEI